MILRQKRLYLAPEHAKKAYNLLFDRLYAKEGYNYMPELGKKAEKLGLPPGKLLAKAREQLESPCLRFDRKGRIRGAKKAGNELAAVLGCTYENMKVFVVADGAQLSGGNSPLPKGYYGKFDAINGMGDATVVAFAKALPSSLQSEAREIGKEKFHSLSWLDNPLLWHHAGMSGNMLNFLRHDTIWVGCTGTECRLVAMQMDRELEQPHGFERQYMKRLVRAMSEKEKADTLSSVLLVCGAVAGIIEGLKHIYPVAMYVAGGALSDVFGAIIPDVSQSVSHVKEQSASHAKRFWSKAKAGWKVFLGGAAGLPFALAAGWLASYLYSPAAPMEIRVLAGALFGLACAAGTVGTSVAATIGAYRAFSSLEKEGMKAKASTGKRAWEAMNEAILKVPFRIGHTVLGLPLQLAYGMLAGAFLFFDKSWFVISEGVLEIVLGALFAFTYTKGADFLLERRLKKGDWSQAEPQKAKS